MRSAFLLCLVAGAFAAVPQARAQSLQSEEVQGNRRLCNYGASNGILSGSTQHGRQHAVGIGENCPLTLPVSSSNRPAPPTAVLFSDSPSQDGRICVYEQWGTRWTFTLTGRTGCPPAAGMIPREQRLPPEPLRLPAPGETAPGQ